MKPPKNIDGNLKALYYVRKHYEQEQTNENAAIPTRVLFWTSICSVAVTAKMQLYKFCESSYCLSCSADSTKRRIKVLTRDRLPPTCLLA